MEDLIELVAASFVRHGIENPAGVSSFVRPAQNRSTQAIRSVDPPLTTTLPEHNYRKSPQAEPTP